MVANVNAADNIFSASMHLQFLFIDAKGHPLVIAQ
jgi:hypothetical protein